MTPARLPGDLARQVDGTRLMAHLAEFARWTKHAGTPGERSSLEYIRKTLDSYGYTTDLILHDAYISLPGEARLDVAGESLSCITQSFSRPAPAAGLRGTVVALGSGTKEDFDHARVAGKIVLLDGIATPAVSQRASRAGAIGQIHLSPGDHAHEMCISPVWGSPTHRTLSELPSTVVVTLAKAEGERLKSILKGNTETEVVLHAAVDTGWRKTPILVAALDPVGAREDTPFVMFSGHHDTWHYGVMDNGGANATMIEVARLCASCRDLWRRGLRIYFWSGHSQGRYSGSTWYADTHWDDLERRAIAHVNIDSTGARGNTVLCDAQAAAELVPLAREALRVEGHQPLTGHRVARAGDQSFWGIGVPAIFSSLGEQPSSGAPAAAAFLFGGPNKQGSGTGWWWHTPEDTLDKMDEQIAVRDTRVYLHVVTQLLTARVLPIDYASHAAMMLGVIEPLKNQLGDRFDLTHLFGEATRLQHGAQVLAEKSAGDPSEADALRINRCIMALSRALVPVDHTLGDRFDHDPALALPTYPALESLRELAATEPGSEMEKFVGVAARRGVNRVLRALGDANAALESCLADLVRG